MRSRCLVAVALVLSLEPTGARAQGSPPPPRAAQPPPAQYQPPPTSYRPPPPGYGQPAPLYDPPPPAEPPPAEAPPGQPPPVVAPAYVYPSAPTAPLSESETHAPKYALWAGARLSYVGFGFNFYDNQLGKPETTGNFLGNGIAPQVDLGARLSYRYVPYLFWEHGFMGQGHRFEGTDASSSTDFYGIGLRFASGDVDSVSFLTDLSIGKRVVRVSSGAQSYAMSGLEFFRLGLGAEIRLATLLVLTPLASISSGALNDTDGDIAFRCGGPCGDQLTGPTYKNGAVIETGRAYVVLSLGVGLHFDLFGK